MGTAWTDNLAVGVDALDHDHKKLVDSIVQLEEAIGTNRAGETLEPLLEYLVDYSQSHMLAEEALMQVVGYPDVAAHHAEHAEFLRRVNELRAQLKQGRPEVARSTASFLKNWLVEHIRTADAAYQPYVTRGLPR